MEVILQLAAQLMQQVVAAGKEHIVARQSSSSSGGSSSTSLGPECRLQLLVSLVHLLDKMQLACTLSAAVLAAWQAQLQPVAAALESTGRLVAADLQAAAGGQLSYDADDLVVRAFVDQLLDLCCQDYMQEAQHLINKGGMFEAALATAAAASALPPTAGPAGSGGAAAAGTASTAGSVLAAGEWQYFSLLASFSKLLGLMELRFFSSRYWIGLSCWEQIQNSAITISACHMGICRSAVHRWLQPGARQWWQQQQLEQEQQLPSSSTPPAAALAVPWLHLCSKILLSRMAAFVGILGAELPSDAGQKTADQWVTNALSGLWRYADATTQVAACIMLLQLCSGRLAVASGSFMVLQAPGPGAAAAAVERVAAPVSSSGTSSSGDGNGVRYNLHASCERLQRLHGKFDGAVRLLHLASHTAFSVNAKDRLAQLFMEAVRELDGDAALLAAQLCAAQHSKAKTLQLLRQSSIIQQVPQQLGEIGEQLAAALPVQYCCNNSYCTNLARSSELRLVGGKQCICGGCELARYCSKDCQAAAWPGHRPVCKQLRQLKQQQ